MEAQFYWNALRRSWWLILLGPLLAAGTAYFYSKSLTPIYSTSSTLLVNQTQVPGSIQYNDVLTSERLTNTYAALLREQRGYLRSVIDQLGAQVSYILVSDLSNDTFFARIVLDVNGSAMEIDSRPSDAIALALRARVPIFAESSVLDKAGVSGF